MFAENLFIILKLFIIFCFIILGLIVFKGYKQHQEIISKVQILDCKLLNKSYNGSTLTVNPVPMVGLGMNGRINAGIGLVTSGQGKRFITMFDCGTYGTIVSENENIFRLAKDGENKLEISFYKNLLNQNTYRIFALYI